MKNNLKVSIITVCLNSEKHIEKTILSVLKQTYKNIEYIIIDGDSTDKTLEIINKYKSEISSIISEKDEGIYDAMNKGIKASTGDIIYFLNSDDRLYDKNVLLDIVNEFIYDIKIGVIYGKAFWTNVSKHIAPYLVEYRIIHKKIDLLKPCFSQQSIFYRRWTFNKIGLFNTKYKIYGDYNWLLSAYNSSVKIKFINRYIAQISAQGVSSQNTNRIKIERLKIIYRNYSLILFFFYIFKYHLLSSLKFHSKKLYEHFRALSVR